MIGVTETITETWTIILPLLFVWRATRPGESRSRREWPNTAIKSTATGPA